MSNASPRAGQAIVSIATMSSQASLPAGGNGHGDEYVKREDLERMKDELKAAIAQVKEGGARNAKPAV